MTDDTASCGTVTRSSSGLERVKVSSLTGPMFLDEDLQGAIRYIPLVSCSLLEGRSFIYGPIVVLSKCTVPTARAFSACHVVFVHHERGELK